MSYSDIPNDLNTCTHVPADPDDWVYGGLVQDFWNDYFGLFEQLWLVDQVFDDIPEYFERPDASWRRMNLTDPLMVFVKLDIEVNEGRKVLDEGGFFWNYDDEDDQFFLDFYDEEADERYCTYRYIEITNPKGVTAGEIFDALRREFWSTPADEGSEIATTIYGRMSERGKMVAIS